MTTRRSLIKRKKKAPRLSKVENLANLKYLGPEPSFERGSTLSRDDLARSLQWYGLMRDSRDARSALQSYLTKVDRKEEAKSIRLVPDKRVNVTYSWVGHLLSMDLTLPDHSGVVERMNASIEHMISKADEADSDENQEEVQEFKRPSIQDRVKKTISDLFVEVEGMLDDEIDFDPYAHLQKVGASPQAARALSRKFEGQADELEEALKKTGDPQVREGYSRYPKEWLKKRAELLRKIVDDSMRFADTGKKVRLPRKKKPISIEKKIKFMNPQKESNEFKVASIPVEKILSATELWAFNTKYKTITVFRAPPGRTLDVERTRVVGFDDTVSTTKRTGRRASQYLDTVLNGNRNSVKKLMETIKSDPIKLQDRIGDSTILLRTYT